MNCSIIEQTMEVRTMDEKVIETEEGRKRVIYNKEGRRKAMYDEDSVIPDSVIPGSVIKHSTRTDRTPFAEDVKTILHQTDKILNIHARLIELGFPPRTVDASAKSLEDAIRRQEGYDKL